MATFSFDDSSFKSRVPDQNGVSEAWYIAEIHHSGQKPSKCKFLLRQKMKSKLSLPAACVEAKNCQLCNLSPYSCTACVVWCGLGHLRVKIWHSIGYPASARCYRVSAGTGWYTVTGWIKKFDAASISVWQHIKLFSQIRPCDTLASCWDIKQPTSILQTLTRSTVTINIPNIKDICLKVFKMQASLNLLSQNKFNTVLIILIKK